MEVQTEGSGLPQRQGRGEGGPRRSPESRTPTTPDVVSHGLGRPDPDNKVSSTVRVPLGTVSRPSPKDR